ncbi:glycosyltransferase [Vibrio breoganii]|uniref:glycosyltransferase n=1 Tax=Vibrio breoganii TaxID=553239 RepID=UPI0010BE0E1A|nr:glycosyltransferase [Vibrio breoganii]TKG24514.1 glycosyltransferase [Vibrio breoganii]
MPKSNIAVIMSVYKEDTVTMFTQAVNSILKQSIPCDLLIYQDGIVSESLSRYIADIEKLSNVFIIRCKENKGLAVALNSLIEVSILKRYQYIARMDSDDISHPKRLAKQVDFLDLNSNVDVVGTSCHEFGASFALNEKHLPRTHEELVNFSITRCPFIHPTVMFRSSVFTSGFRYPTDTNLTEDMALWFLLLNNKIQFANINEVLLDYRLNEGTIKRRSGFKKAISEVIIRFKNMLSLKKVSFKNIILILSRIAFHLLPERLLKIAYWKLR